MSSTYRASLPPPLNAVDLKTQHAEVSAAAMTFVAHWFQLAHGCWAREGREGIASAEIADGPPPATRGQARVASDPEAAKARASHEGGERTFVAHEARACTRLASLVAQRKAAEAPVCCCCCCCCCGGKEVLQFYISQLPIDRSAAVTGTLGFSEALVILYF